MPFLSGTRALCRIGRALGFGQVNLADKAVINLNVLPAGAVLVIAALMHDDFLNHFPQEGGSQFLKGKVLSDNPHKLFRVDGGGLRLVQFCLQSGGAVFQFPLFLLIVCRQFHETLVADFAVHIVLIQPLDNAAHFGNALLCLFKLLGGCGGLSLAADLVLLDKQLYKEYYALKAELAELQEQLSAFENAGGRAQKFLKLTERYAAFTDLTPAILNEFISRIEVHERDKKRAKQAIQHIGIYFNYIGKFENEVTQLTEPTEQEIRQMREEIEEAKKEKSRAYHRQYSREYRARNLEKQREYDRIKAREYRARRKAQTAAAQPAQ